MEQASLLRQSSAYLATYSIYNVLAARLAGGQSAPRDRGGSPPRHLLQDLASGRDRVHEDAPAEVAFVPFGFDLQGLYGSGCQF
jgi:hypothetical protein